MSISEAEQLRRDALARFEAYARDLFDAEPRWRSLTLAVAQYFDDQAADAVHSLLVYSEHPPTWPHRCPPFDAPMDPAATTVCRWCFHGGLPRDPLEWDDDGTAIPAFEPFCKEGCNQDDEHDRSYLPYAVAERISDGVSVRVVGEPVRPWLVDVVLPELDAELAALLAQVYERPASDTPRKVLGDWLAEQGDPRGAFILAQLRGEEVSALGRTAPWSGALAAVTSTPVTVFRRGFPAECRVYYESPAVARTVAHDPAWATVERITWRERSAIGFGPHLRSLTAIEGLPGRALAALLEWEGLPRLRELGVALAPEESLAGLERAVALERLSLSALGAGLHVWDAELAWSALEVHAVVHGESVPQWLERARIRGVREICLDAAGIRVAWGPAGAVRMERSVLQAWAPRADQQAMLVGAASWFARHAPDSPVTYDPDAGSGLLESVLAAFPDARANEGSEPW